MFFYLVLWNQTYHSYLCGIMCQGAWPIFDGALALWMGGFIFGTMAGFSGKVSKGAILWDIGLNSLVEMDWIGYVANKNTMDNMDYLAGQKLPFFPIDVIGNIPFSLSSVVGHDGGVGVVVMADD